MRSALFAAAAALAVGLSVRPLLRAARKAVLRLRIHRLRERLSALSCHAATARALRLAYRHRVDAKTGTDSMRERVLALRTLERRALAGLEATRQHVDHLLLGLLDVAGGAGLGTHKPSESVAALEARVRAELAVESTLGSQLLGAHEASAVIPSAPPPRHVLLRLEQRAIESLGAAAVAGDGAYAGPRPAQPVALRRAVRALRAMESSLDFQAELLAEQRRVALASGYTGENFAYGSTPLQSWLVLFECAPVQAALRAAGPGNTRYAVLGSSLGSLVIYGACVYGLPSRGIELMPLLANRASDLASRAGVAGASFECADMLDCSLADCAILLLASQCWDRSLIAAVRSKLLAELQVGALVLDYTSALGEEEEGEEGVVEGTPTALPQEGEAASRPASRRRFALQTTVSAPVSWDGAHKFWVWRVEDGV